MVIRYCSPSTPILNDSPISTVMNNLLDFDGSSFAPCHTIQDIDMMDPSLNGHDFPQYYLQGLNMNGPFFDGRDFARYFPQGLNTSDPCLNLADDPTPACRVSLADNDPFKILMDETTRLENCIVQQKRRLTVEEHQKLSPRYDSILSELKRRLDWATTQDARSRIEDEISNMRARSLLFLCQPIAPIADPDRYRAYLEEARSKYKDTYGLVIGGLSKCHPLHLKAVKVFAAFTMSTLNQKGEARSILAAALHAIGITAPGYDLSSISEEAKLLIQEIFQAWNAPNC